MNVSLLPTSYDPDAVDIGIVHLGLGAFVRAHIAVYLEQLLNQKPGPWGICAANIRSNQGIVDTLQQQNGCYTVAEYASEQQLTLRQVSCLREVLFAGNGQVQLLLARMAQPQTKIVTLTVTEKGYFYDAGRAALKLDAPEIQHDLANPQQPKTAIALLAAALDRRRLAKQRPFTVLSCDNMPHNGRATRTAVLEFARALNPELADWIAAEVRFPSSMVDRIVPAVTPETIESITQQLARAGADWTDRAPVACEAFSQWVIEDDFPTGRPALEAVGAVMVADVAPWEAMKLRMLNGSHSLLAYLGSLAGLPYVADCVDRPEYRALLRHYMLEEAAPTLQMPADTDLPAYAEDLLQRFANGSLHHKTLQIAMDGSQKIPQRWLDGARAQLDAGNLPRATALGLAAWISFLQRADEQGNLLPISDPLADELQRLACAASSTQDKVTAFLQLPLFAHYRLAEELAFAAEITAAINTLQTSGVAAAIQRVTGPSARR